MKKIMMQTARDFLQLKCQYRATTLAYTTALAFVPFLSVIVAILSKLTFSNVAISELQHFIFSNFVPEQGEKILIYVEQFTLQAQQLPRVGFVFLVIMTTILLSLVGKNINRLWHQHERRRWYRRYMMYASILFSIPVLMLVSLSISSYFFSIELLARGGFLVEVRSHLLHYLPIIVELIGFTLLNWMVPNCKVKLRYALLGAVMTTVLFEMIKQGFGFYLKLFPTYDLLYGALAIVPIFLIWLYLFWMVVLLGVVFVRACHQYDSNPAG